MSATERPSRPRPADVPEPETGGRPRLRSIVLPVEHGGWGFLVEPIALGLLVAPSLAGVLLGLAAAGVFLLHQPLRLVVKDALKGKRYPRTIWALRFAVGCAALGAVGFALALATASHAFWQPLVLAVACALIQLRYDAVGRGRELVPELAGALALLTTASMIALAGGWLLPNALALWIILAARTIVSILYVRARLRLERGAPIRIPPVLAAHSLALALLVGLVLAGLAPWLSAGVMTVLLARAAYGLSPYRRPARPRAIGFQEMGFGVLNVIAAALGYRLGV